MAEPQFEILEIVASGAFGSVCKARRDDDVVVALKVLKQVVAANPRAMTRLRDEARMLARLQHANILRVHRLLEIEGRPVVEMEYVDGASLADLIGQEKHALPAEVALEIVRCVAAALEMAWEGPSLPDQRPMRIIHRDIKPANVMVTVEGLVKVLDFGIAKGDLPDREAETVSIVLGTRGYTAPERSLGEADTPAVDVYALGVMLFELLTGRALVQSMNPHRHDASIEPFLAHLTPAGLDATAVRGLVREMCRYDARARPTVGDVARAIGGLLEAQGTRPDLVRFAAERVAPWRRARTVVGPRAHPAWADVAFLEKGASARDLAVMTPQVVRRRAAADDIAPLLDVLDRADPPWWAFWVTRASKADVVAALGKLRGNPDSRVLVRARALAGHKDPDIAGAARQLVGP